MPYLDLWHYHCRVLYLLMSVADWWCTAWHSPTHMANMHPVLTSRKTWRSQHSEDPAPETGSICQNKKTWAQLSLTEKKKQILKSCLWRLKDFPKHPFLVFSFCWPAKAVCMGWSPEKAVCAHRESTGEWCSAWLADLAQVGLYYECLFVLNKCLRD